MNDPKPLPYALQRLIDAVDAVDDLSRFTDRRDVPELIAAAREAASAWRSIYGHIEASPGHGRVPDPVEPVAERIAGKVAFVRSEIRQAGVFGLGAAENELAAIDELLAPLLPEPGPDSFEPMAVLEPRAFVDLAVADEAVRIAATPGKGVLIEVPTAFRLDRPLLITHELTYDEVDRIAMERCAQWHPPESEPWVITDWTNAVCGEAGELANVAKKIRRITTGTKTFATEQEREDALAELRAKAAKELADVELYLPMVAHALGVHRASGVVAKFNEVSVREGFPQRLREISPSAGADQPHAFQFSVDGGCKCGEPREHPVHMVRSVPIVAVDPRPIGERLAAGETIDTTEIRHDDPKPADPPGAARQWAGGGFNTGPGGARRCGACNDCSSPYPVWCSAWVDPPAHIAEEQVAARHRYWAHHDHVFQPKGSPELASAPCFNCGCTERGTSRHIGSGS